MLTDQVTPAFAAVIGNCGPSTQRLRRAASEEGGAFSVTEIGALGAEMVIVADADFVESVTEVAVTVTVAGLGTVTGAIYCVAVPLAVEAAVKAAAL